MIKRLRDESGFGLLELLIAMVILNVGLFALVGAFNGATVAISRAGTVSAATAVADKQMEIYRGLADCAIWLDSTSAYATNTFPTKGAGTAYEADTAAYMDPYSSPQVPLAFLDKSASGTAQALLPWATLATTQVSNAPWSSSHDLPTSCIPSGSFPLSSTTTPPDSAVKAIQNVPGPDGTLFPVYTYITIVQTPPVTLSGETQPASSTWQKQVTIVVHDPKVTTKVLARQTSLFAPSEAKGELGS